MTEGLEASGTLDLVITTSAANDVLLEQGYRIQTAPVCEADTGSDPEVAVRCVGRTRSDRAITVTVTTGKTMTVSVADKQIYQGSVDDILQRNLSANPAG